MEFGEPRELTADDVEFSITTLREDINVREDMALGEWIEEEELVALEKRLELGDEWAWCVVKVTATWKGLEGDDFLGEASYADENAFKDSGYYQDMRVTALQDLNATVSGLFYKLEELLEPTVWWEPLRGREDMAIKDRNSQGVVA